MHCFLSRTIQRLPIYLVVVLVAAVTPASAQPVLTAHTANGTDTSYYGIPLEIVFHLDENGIGEIWGITIPLELLFSNGNIMGPLAVNQQFFFEPAADVFFNRGLDPDYAAATDPDSVLIYGILGGGVGWLGAADFCRIEVLPTDTGHIAFTTTALPPNEQLLAIDYNAQAHPITWNSPTVVVEPCPSERMCDVNQDGTVTAADVIYLVNFAFKGGPEPLPVQLAGDADCNRRITAGDIIYLVNYQFKSGPEPCPCLVPGS